MVDSNAVRPLFVYGPLRDKDVLAVALGDLAERVETRAGVLEGFETCAVDDGAYPALRAVAAATSPGLLLSVPDAALWAQVLGKLDLVATAFGYALHTQQVRVDGTPQSAQVYQRGGAAEDSAVPWVLEDWAQSHKPLFLEALREIVTHQLSDAVLAGVLRRASQRVHLRHRTFDGGLSAEMRREVFVSGDAVSVLPWDPATDRVLLIEQFRAGLLARGEVNPWNLEVIAGLIDGAEAPEYTARREAEEEAGLTLGRMHLVGGYYASPGVLSEYLTSFIGEADLSAAADGLHGLDSEHEDIRTLVLPRAEAMEAVRSGEARNAPLLMSLMALEAERERLSAAWGDGVAVPPTAG